jgi:hypothetical protein
MPKDRLNLLIERRAIEKARRYSERHRTSVSKLVTDFLQGLPEEESADQPELTPIVKRLLGAAKGADLDEYRDYLGQKYLK